MALLRISLKNFVIVPALELDLPPQFTALTGETGAGKSILIDALQLALGQRADVDVVYEGANQAEIAIEFEATPASRAWLDGAGFDSEAGILVRRVIDTKGKSKAWINGSAATLTQLRELGDFLVDIHGQHAWASLAKSSQALHLLDSYAKLDNKPLRAAWQAWRQAHKTLQEATALQATMADERERLQWQLAELDKLKPQAAEWEPLNQEQAEQAHAQDLIDGTQKALHALDAGRESGALPHLQTALSALDGVKHLQPHLQALHEQLVSVIAQTQDLAHELRASNRHVAPDAQRLAQLDSRLALWLSLARRYKSKPEDLPALLATWRDKLNALEQAADLASLEQAERQAYAAYEKLAKTLGLARRKAAPALEREITTLMQTLGMAGGLLQIAIAPCAATETGLESVEFLVAGHAGVSPKPISKVASGGELSRIALAVAVVISGQEGAPSLIFDEVDSGIGGAAAHTVGALLRQLGHHRQVLAVTHLAQVAASAHQHLLVSKQQQAGRTSSQVQLMGAKERVHEVARMLGGSASATSLAHAQEMLEQVA